MSTQLVPHSIVPAEHALEQLPCAHTLPSRRHDRTFRSWTRWYARPRTSRRSPACPSGTCMTPQRTPCSRCRRCRTTRSWLTFVMTSTHAPPHDVEPSGHDAAHLPLLHTSCGLHAIEHPPQ